MTQPTTDGFTNLVSNLGAANGKTAHNSYTLTPCTQQEVSFAYRSSTWFGKIVDIPADDATREWRSWKADSDAIAALEATEKRLGVQHKVNQALKWSRLYGGAVIIPDLPGVSSQEYVPNGALNVRFLHVLHRHQITAQGLITNPLSPYYGQPEYYTTHTETGTEVHFHPSRVVLFNGRRSGDTTTRDAWGDSIWQYLSDAITASDAGAAAIAGLMQEAKVDVVRIDQFMSQIGGAKYEADQMARWNLVAVMKSIANVVLLDKEDEWDQKTISWGGLPDVMQTLLTIMAGAADIPVTRLIGTSAAGLNATGEGDLRNYYDSVRSKQDLQIGPMLAPLDRIIMADAGVTDPDVWYDWKPLWQPSEKEKAETQKLRAETYAIELTTGGVNEPAFSKAYENAAIETGLYPGLESAIEEFAIEEPDMSEADPADLTVGGGETVQEQALNGAQINAVKDIVISVVNGEIPFETGLYLLLLGFPSIEEEEARRVLTPALNFTPRAQANGLPSPSQSSGT